MGKTIGIGWLAALVAPSLTGCFELPDAACDGRACETDSMTSGTGTTESASEVSSQGTVGPTATSSDSGPSSSGTTTEASGSATTQEGTTMSGPTGGPTTTATTGEPASHVIFVTAVEFTGPEVDGLSGADLICTTAMGDGRPWSAILTDSTAAAQDRIGIDGPVYNMLGELVAADAAELWSGTLQASAAYDENGFNIPNTQLTWVGSATDHCADWTSDVGLAAFGVQSSLDQWLGEGGTFQCLLALHLYCISQ